MYNITLQHENDKRLKEIAKELENKPVTVSNAQPQEAVEREMAHANDI